MYVVMSGLKNSDSFYVYFGPSVNASQSCVISSEAAFAPEFSDKEEAAYYVEKLETAFPCLPDLEIVKLTDIW